MVFGFNSEPNSNRCENPPDHSAVDWAVAAPASGLDRKPRKKEKKARPKPSPNPCRPPLLRPHDSLVAVWLERAVLRFVQEFFDNAIFWWTARRPAAPTRSMPASARPRIAHPAPLQQHRPGLSTVTPKLPLQLARSSRILGMSQYYFPLIEDELLKKGLPIELRALPSSEIGLSVTAVSLMGAVGQWQFMPSTGKSYGLEVNSLVNERDPRPFDAGHLPLPQRPLRHLQRLVAGHRRHNCGPSSVNKALARAGEETPSGTSTTTLPRETRGLRPHSLHRCVVCPYAYHRQHGIELTSPDSADHRHRPHRPDHAPPADRLDNRRADRSPTPAQPAV